MFCAMFLSLVIGADAAEVKTPEFCPPEVAVAMLEENNRLRESQGKVKQTLNPKLTQAAQNYANYLAEHRGFGHYADGRSPGTRIAETGYKASVWAENMAGDFKTVKSAFDCWRNSGGHWSNILSNNTECGFGYQLDKNGCAYWIGVYANPAK